MAKINRRDFLKLLPLTGGALLFSKFAPKAFPVGAQGNQSLPNIVIFVFDAMTARNLSLYGYRRHTTPNLEKFAEHATVYHSHHSGGNFTTPGTASLLMGIYPWTHRALNLGGLVTRSLVNRNIFTLIGSQYHRIAYSQNLWANYLFEQFVDGIDTILHPGAFSTIDQIAGEHFPNHHGDAYRAYEDFLFRDGTPASLVFGVLERLFQQRRNIFAKSPEYNGGLPQVGPYPIYYKLRDVFDGMGATIQKLSSPYFGYFHIWAPHAPYMPTKPFDGMFNDNFRPPHKPQHPLGYENSIDKLKAHRMAYDSFIANVDDEFGKMINSLESQGVLDNTYVIVTSDHGESFERGVDGHGSHLLFEPLINIPLLISAPGQKEHQDIFTPTSCVDVLPTLLSLAGRPIPEWCEGTILPGLGGDADPQRSIFSIDALTNPAYSPLKMASIAMCRENYKLTCYTGFFDQDLFELYDIVNDPEEMTNLYPNAPAITQTLKDELLTRLHMANAPFVKE